MKNKIIKVHVPEELKSLDALMAIPVSDTSIGNSYLVTKGSESDLQQARYLLRTIYGLNGFSQPRVEKTFDVVSPPGIIIYKTIPEGTTLTTDANFSFMPKNYMKGDYIQALAHYVSQLPIIGESNMSREERERARLQAVMQGWSRNPVLLSHRETDWKEHLKTQKP